MLHMSRPGMGVGWVVEEGREGDQTVGWRAMNKRVHCSTFKQQQDCAPNFFGKYKTQI